MLSPLAVALPVLALILAPALVRQAQATGFTATGSMTAARQFNSATLLPNGMVLIAGGWNGAAGLSSAELYDPVTGTFTATGSMTSVRWGHSATLLPNGTVLIAGGVAFNDVSGLLSSAELYDPATGAFTATGSMTSTYCDHSATLLPNGTVLIAGGSNGAAQSHADLYDPATGTFTATGSMTSARYGHSATLLPNGTVLIAGGSNFEGKPGSYLSSAELYDPATGTFTATGSMTTARMGPSATLLPNGTVLIAGGQGNISWADTYSSAELYDPATSTFTATGSMTSARTQHSATLLPNGTVLIAGGANSILGILSSAELYDPATGAFTATGSMTTARAIALATLLPNGTVLIAGGQGATFLSSAELYTPTTECASDLDCNDGNDCTNDVCQPPFGVCTHANKVNGTACNDGNACTQTDTCQAGVCTGGNPVVCIAADQCHVAGTCSPITGKCSNPNAPNGTTCNDGNACTLGDVCRTGACVGTNFCPTDKGQCKNGGWGSLINATGQPFKNQGDCVSYVNTGK